MITIYINNKEIKTEAGKTILSVAKENGINIPTLCHDKNLSPYGSCWVCSVEIEGRRNLATSCGTTVSDGMRIHTNTNRVTSSRKMALDLILSDHYADCEAPCKIACPDKVDIQTYVSLIANGKYHEAVRVIKENLPMPLSVGRICPAFCERECRRQIVDEPIAIRQLKRYVADFDKDDVWHYIPELKEKNNKKVAIIGAGPSGLTCGYYLSIEGYEVDVFEASPKAGGWLRYGIPEYRLPKNILDTEIDFMCETGMKIHTNKKIGADITLDDLSKNYDAVYIAVGAQKPMEMKVKGDHLNGIYLGVDFLKNLTLGEKFDLGKKVAIIGGGNTAIDCARTSVRLGAEVTLVYRRTLKEMPAEDYEIEEAKNEGVKFLFLTNPVEFIGEKHLNKIKFEKMVLGEPDASGRRRPQPTGEYFVEDFDSVIPAISQKVDINFLGKEITIPLSRKNTTMADSATMFTGEKNIFAGGDFRLGPSTAIEATADGRAAAEYIDRFIKGENLDVAKMFNSVKAKTVKDVSQKEYEKYEKIPRIKMPILEMEKAKNTFEEVELGLKDDEIQEEAKRCLECGCQVNQTCSLRKYATEYDVDQDIFIGQKNHYLIDDSHPFILRDSNKCIDCGICVRTCAEIQGAGVLGYINRGFATLIAPEFGESLTFTDCESCGKCVEVCPVGALTSNNITYKLNSRMEESTTQNCGICGCGCQIQVHTQTDSVLTIDAPKEDELGFNDRNICFKGRYGWQTIQEETKLKKPLVYEKNQWNETNWFSLPLQMKIKADEAKSKVIYVSPDCSNEEILLAKETAKNLGADIFTLSTKSTFSEKLINENLYHKKYEDIQNAETMIIVGEISHTWRTLCRLEQRKGKKLILINQSENDFNKFADKLFNKYSIEKSLENFSEMDLSDKTLFIYNEDNISDKAIWEIWKLASKEASFTLGSGVFVTSNFSNRNGLRVFNIPKTEFKQADFMLLFGENLTDGEWSKIDDKSFVIQIATHLPKNSKANVIIPQSTYLEQDATRISDQFVITEFKNPKKSNLMEMILQIFGNAGFIKNSAKENSIWKNSVEEEFKKIDFNKKFANSKLAEYLEKNKPVNSLGKRPQTLKENIMKLKKKTKK